MNADVNYKSYGFFPVFSVQVQEVLDQVYYFYGRYRHFSIEVPKTGSRELEAKSSKIDRFRVKWDYGGHVIHWWVIFNSDSPHHPPDFIFHNTDFQPVMSNLPSLTNWDVNDHSSLSKVLQELLEELVRFDLAILPRSLQEQYNELMTKTWISKGHCSLSLADNMDYLFWMRIVIPDYSQDHYFVDVLFTHSAREYACVDPELILSRDLKKKLVDIIRPKHIKSLLVYMSQVYQQVSERLQENEICLEKRRELMTSMLTLQGDALLEIDTEMFRHVNFLLEYNQFYVEVVIRIPPRYPVHSEPIEIIAQDAYSTKHCKTGIVEISESDPQAIALSILEETEKLTKQLAEEATTITQGSSV